MAYGRGPLSDDRAEGLLDDFGRVYKAFSTALDDAEKWAEKWRPPDSKLRGRGRSPNHALLGQREILTMRDLGGVLDVDPKNAKKWAEKMGIPVRAGKRDRRLPREAHVTAEETAPAPPSEWTKLPTSETGARSGSSQYSEVRP